MNSIGISQLPNSFCCNERNLSFFNKIKKFFPAYKLLLDIYDNLMQRTMSLLKFQIIGVLMEILESNNSATADILQLVSFMIGNEEYAVDIFYVKEINRLSHITKVPNAPEFIEGVINLRGRIIPVIDLRVRMGLPKKTHDKDSRIIVIEENNLLVGFLVDAVKEVIRISKNITEEPPEIVSSHKTDFISSVGKLEDRLLILIDLKKILSKEEQDNLKNVA